MRKSIFKIEAKAGMKILFIASTILFICIWYLFSCDDLGENCYDIGFRTGKCMALKELGLGRGNCDAIRTPQMCDSRYKDRFMEGLSDGKEFVYSKQSEKK